MILCVPVRAPGGLASCVEPHLPNAGHLLFFDVETRDIRHVALREHLESTAEAPQFDVVLCASVDKATKDALNEKGIFAFGTKARTAGEAIAEFEALNPPRRRPETRGHADGEHGARGCDGKGGCGQKHGDGHEHETGQCACGGHGRHHDAVSRKMHAESLKIAVSSQNRKTITGHAGRCRKFWVYEIRGNEIDGKTLRELAPEQTLHSLPLGGGHPLDDVHVMITSGMSPFLYQRLQQGGIRPFVTEETDPDAAVRILLEKVARV
jgi:predicted Fe-Mo cluster-binding NifX family protein